MNSMNLMYNPDHEQVLEHHKELLEKAEQERFERSAMAAPKSPLPSIRKLLRSLFSGHHTSKIAPVAQRPSSTRL